MSVRSTAKAIIVHNDKVLLNRCFDKNYGHYYSLPGGGQNTYETLREAIVRECIEETGYTVTPVRFSALCEEICLSERTKELYPEYIHKMYHIFLCKLENKKTVKPTEIDDMQIESIWIDINNLDKIHMQPECLNGNIKKLINDDQVMFLGAKHIPYNHG